MRHGILLIDKPEGPTSHDVVQTVRNTLGEQKIGHLGTLDPAASGLLVLFVGRKALKIVELFQDTHKEYEARIRFGSVSTTYDREGVIGEVPAKKGWHPPTENQLQLLLNDNFLGDISQIPPLHSAVHVDGKRAYNIVRKDPNIGLQLQERTVTVTKAQLVSYAYPDACIAIACSSGTYIRSLAHDLGTLVRSGAYLGGLRRTRVGPWKISDAHPLPCHAERSAGAERSEAEERSQNIRWTDVVPLKNVLADFPRTDLSEDQWKDVQYGRSVNIATASELLIAWFNGLPVAILERTNGGVKPKKVF
jgi:tRNA pseudouridine55 synthase